MFDRRAILLAVAACLAAAPAARADDDDYWPAQHALQQGQIRSAQEIIAQVGGDLGGQVIRTKLKYKYGVSYYEFKVRTPNGWVSEVSVDAATGAILGRDN
ncbi:MAG TPA: PepSY domain-containing protein [Hyphomicrobiaceae bacterium]|jgi:uncharacterized membrane protein YkoI|nr:PepSY domain-containing protein [Hyphomicrobiaceae bacterium]